MIDWCCKLYTHTFYRMYDHNSSFHKLWALLYLIEPKVFNFIIPLYFKIVRIKK